MEHRGSDGTMSSKNQFHLRTHTVTSLSNKLKYSDSVKKFLYDVSIYFKLNHLLEEPMTTSSHAGFGFHQSPPKWEHINIRSLN